MKSELEKIIKRLKSNIEYVSSKFLNTPEEELRRKPAPNKWSKKELLGHLIDSAANNHHRFIKAQFLPSPMFVEGYAQNDWVQVQKYNEKDSQALLNLWIVYNEHIIFIMQNTPDKNLETKLNPEDAFENADTLFLLMKDYFDHLDHHFKQIFSK